MIYFVVWHKTISVIIVISLEISLIREAFRGDGLQPFLVIIQTLELIKTLQYLLLKRFKAENYK